MIPYHEIDRLRIGSTGSAQDKNLQPMALDLKTSCFEY